MKLIRFRQNRPALTAPNAARGRLSAKLGAQHVSYRELRRSRAWDQLLTSI
jgi:hypothetical protein